jgi:protein-disulfide isomerase
LDTLATVALLVAAGVVIWKQFATLPSTAGQREVKPPEQPISLSGAPVKGNGQATVAVIEYSDFQCPYCSRFTLETLPEIDRTYVQTGRVKLAFKHLPLPIHAQAQKAAEAAECAGVQGKFWPMHDALFAKPPDLSVLRLKRLAGSLGLNMRAFERCLAGEMTAKVEEDIAAAKVLRVTGTPTFFIGRVSDDGVRVSEVLVGVAPVSAFKERLDRLLARQ